MELSLSDISPMFTVFAIALTSWAFWNSWFGGTDTPPTPTFVPMISAGRTPSTPMIGQRLGNPGESAEPPPPYPKCKFCPCPQIPLAAAAGVALPGAMMAPLPSSPIEHDLSGPTVLADPDPRDKWRCKKLFDTAYLKKEPWVKEACLAWNKTTSE